MHVPGNGVWLVGCQTLLVHNGGDVIADDAAARQLHAVRSVITATEGYFGQRTEMSPAVTIQKG